MKIWLAFNTYGDMCASYKTNPLKETVAFFSAQSCKIIEFESKEETPTTAPSWFATVVHPTPNLESPYIPKAWQAEYAKRTPIYRGEQF